MFQRTRRLSAVFLSALTIALVAEVGECGSAWANQEPNSPVPHWSVLSSPAVGPDGTIYVLTSVGDVHLVEHPDQGGYWTSKSEHNYLYAVEPDGTQRWRSALGSGEHSPSAEFPPQIGPSGIVYASVNRYLYAVDSNGARKWKFPFAGEPSGQPYCGRKWRFSSSENFPGDPLWLDFGSNGAIYFCASNLVYALNPNGTLRWKKSTQATPMVGPDGTVYVTAGNFLCAINSDGTQKWSLAVGRGQIRALRSPQLKSGSPWTIYVVGSDNLYAVAGNGAEKWKFPFTGSLDSLQLGPDGTIHFYEGKVLYALNPDGTLKWKFKSKLYIYSGPRVGLDGAVYLAGGGEVEGVGGLHWR
jgi:outer membrane protein assembly factor BamB